WALVALLDGSPAYHGQFEQMQRDVRDPQFTAIFEKRLVKTWDEDFPFDWAAFVASLDYGYDIPRMAIKHRAATAPALPATAKFAVDQGWQSTGWILKAAQKYAVPANGRYQTARDDNPGPCEPGGVTIEYHDGRPLGVLLGAFQPVND